MTSATFRTFQSEIAPLRRVLLKHARQAFRSAAYVASRWKALGFLDAPDFEAACRESDGLAELLEGLGVEVVWAPDADTGLDSIYVRDAAVVCDGGVVLASMGKEARRREPAELGRALESSGLPVLGSVRGEGRLEGGDVAWLDRRTLVVGRGYRTNDAGIGQLRELLGSHADDVVVVPLPHWNGPGEVFHLMSFFSPVADDVALVHSRLLPVPFREALLDRGIRLVEVDDEEFATQGCNVLAVAPGVVIALEGNPETRRRLEAAGVEVHTYAGTEISLKGTGGPTCLTRPLEREVSSTSGVLV